MTNPLDSVTGEAALALLLDRAAITDVVNAYATGLDRRDWALYRSIFLDEIEMDFASVGLRSGAYTADAWVRSAQTLFAGFSATQHTSSNHVHEIQGDRASCMSNMQAEHFVAREPGDGLDAPDADRWTIGGYYRNKLVRTWKVIDWCHYTPGIPNVAIWTHQQIIAVVDTQAPVITLCPTDTTVSVGLDCNLKQAR